MKTSRQPITYRSHNAGSFPCWELKEPPAAYGPARRPPSAPARILEPVESLLSAQDTIQWCQACLAEDIQGFEHALATRDRLNMAHFAHRAKGAAIALRAHHAADLADRLELASRGDMPLGRQAIWDTVAALKAAIARHFEDKQHRQFAVRRLSF